MISPLALPGFYYHLAGLGTACAGIATGVGAAHVLSFYLSSHEGSQAVTSRDLLSLHKLGFKMALGGIIPAFNIAALSFAAVAIKLPGPLKFDNAKGLFAIASALNVAVWPWTMTYLLPLNRKLEAIDSQSEAKVASAAPMLQDWHFYHAIRTAMFGLSYALSLHALLY